MRDVVHTSEGYVMLNVYHAHGETPIIASSSSAYDTVTPSGFCPVTVAFEAISQVHVFEPSGAHRSQIGFRSDAGRQLS